MELAIKPYFCVRSFSHGSFHFTCIVFCFLNRKFSINIRESPNKAKKIKAFNLISLKENLNLSTALFYKISYKHKKPRIL
jgi:hypothetical protein